MRRQPICADQSSSKQTSLSSSYNCENITADVQLDTVHYIYIFLFFKKGKHSRYVHKQRSRLRCCFHALFLTSEAFRMRCVCFSQFFPAHTQALARPALCYCTELLCGKFFESRRVCSLGANST